MDKKTPYSIMKSAVDKTFEPSEEEIKTINSFFLIRYISNDPSTIYIANVLNCSKNIPVNAQYKFVRNSTMDRVSFVNYPKKEKTSTTKELKLVMQYYKCNESTAKEYIKILGVKETQKIIQKYKK